MVSPNPDLIQRLALKGLDANLETCQVGANFKAFDEGVQRTLGFQVRSNWIQSYSCSSVPFKHLLTTEQHLAMVDQRNSVYA